MLWAVALLLPAAHAQFVQQGPKLVGNDTAGVAAEGKSVAVSADGNTAIVGGYFDSVGRGAGFVYVRANGVWTQQGPKLVGTGCPNCGQGISIALSGDGNTALLGGLPPNGGGWVFTRTNGVWTEQARLNVPGVSPGPMVSLSGDGNTALVGVSLFTRTNGAWALDSTLPAPTGASGDPNFGLSAAVSADGNTVIVGAPADANNSGAAWIYTRTGPGAPWVQQGPKLTGSDLAAPSSFGVSVAISADGNTAIVGGVNDANFIGASWIFTRSNGVWTQQGPKLIGAGAVGNANQGYAVSLSADGNTAISGGAFDNQAIGATWVFTRVNGVWTQQGSKLVGTGWNGAPPFSAPRQGASVAISGDGHTIIEGGQDDQPYGAAWVFAYAGVRLAVSAPASAVAGTPFPVTVTAINPDNSAAPSYNGTVHFSSTDSMAGLPPDSPLTNGTGTFTMTLKTGNSLIPVITVTDTANPAITGVSAPISIIPGATGRFAFSALPGSVNSGAGFSFIVTAFDRFGNFAPSNTSRVHFTSTDPAAILPADSPMTGVATFSAVLKTAGSQTITITDTTNPAVTGTSAVIAVTGGGGTINLALRQPATQSSTFPFAATAVAAAAVDGSTDGNFYDGSVTATFSELSPWWQVDLGASATISSIVVWNRTDCCSNRLSDYWVFVSDTPFAATNSVSDLVGRAGTFYSHQTSAPSPSVNIPVNAQGRYIRVQISSTTFTTLSLAEVQVLGTFVTPPGTNLAQGKAAAQSSDYPGYPSDTAAAAVDGTTDGSFFHGSVTATNFDANPWWEVNLGAAATVNSVVIWNRTDCCSSRLTDYWVFVSNTPFLPTDTPATLQNRPDTFATHQTTAPDPSAVISIGGTAGYTGHYVRVQLSAPGYLSLAEVQVLGSPGSPVPANVAVGKFATQSSTLPGIPIPGANDAVDALTDGNFYHNSVSTTNFEDKPWWQVDLGSSTAVSSVVIWNRTDCCGSRLNDYWVFVSDTPFQATDTPATLQSRVNTFASHQTTAPSPSSTIPVNTPGRYVRVQLSVSDYLSLAEVQVFGQ